MSRRVITRADETAIRERVARAIGAAPGLDFDDTLGLRAIHVRRDEGGMRGIFAPEIVALAAAGIHPGAQGWKMEEAPADTGRRPLPDGWRWMEHGHQSHGLDGPMPDCRTIATVRNEAIEYRWRIPIADNGILAAGGEPTFQGAKSAAESICWAHGLFDAAYPAQAAPDLGAKVAALHEAAGAPPSDAALTLSRLILTGSQLPGERGDEYGMRVGRLCEAFVAELRSSLPASPPAPPSPEAAARPGYGDGALTRYLLEHYRDEWPRDESAASYAIRLLSERTDETIKRIMAGQVGRDLEWHKGQALAAVAEAREANRRLESKDRIITEQEGMMASLAREAETSDANAAELSETLTQARLSMGLEVEAHRAARVALEKERQDCRGFATALDNTQARLEAAIQDRDEARTHLAALRDGVLALAGKVALARG